MDFENNNLNLEKSKNKDKPIFKSEKIEIDSNQEKAKSQYHKKLNILSKEAGNPLKFVQREKVIKNFSFNPQVLKGLDKQGINVFKLGVEAMKIFVNGPIFTDQFHKDHHSRRHWEHQELKLKPKERKYYNSNKLNVGSFSSCIGFLELMAELSNDSWSKNILTRVFKEVSSLLLSMDENNFLCYNSLSDQKKITLILKATNLIQEALDCLELKSKLK